MNSYGFKNKAGSQYRTDKSLGDKPYTRIDNMLINDKRLNYLEKMIMVDILSHPEDWIVVKSYFEKRSGFGKKKFDKSWKVLENAGYISHKRIKGGWKYSVDEDPQQIPFLTHVKIDTLLTTD